MIKKMIVVILVMFFNNVVFAESHDAIIESEKLRAAVYYPPDYSRFDSMKKWPVFLFAHGFAGSALSQDILLDKIASLGILVVAVEHNDPVAFERIPPARGDKKWKVFRYMKNHPFSEKEYNYRPLEFKQFIKLVIDKLPVNRSKVIFAGHSMGGYSIINALNNPYVKPRAIVTYSTGELNYRKGRAYFPPQQLQSLSIPLLLFYGEKEFDPNKGPYAREIARHYAGQVNVYMVKGGTHLSYNDPIRPFQKEKRLQEIEMIFQQTKIFIESLDDYKV